MKPITLRPAEPKRDFAPLAAWFSSFEDFIANVCQTEWYSPAGQFVVIDTASGDWAAMIAIDRKLGYVQVSGKYLMEKVLG